MQTDVEREKNTVVLNILQEKSKIRLYNDNTPSEGERENNEKEEEKSRTHNSIEASIIRDFDECSRIYYVYNCIESAAPINVANN